MGWVDLGEIDQAISAELGFFAGAQFLAEVCRWCDSMWPTPTEVDGIRRDSVWLLRAAGRYAAYDPATGQISEARFVQ